MLQSDLVSVEGQDAMAEQQLPRFQRPPVSEVVMGLAFTPLDGLNVAHFGALQALFAGHKNVEEMPPFQPLLEDLDKKATPGQIRLSLSPMAPATRVGFLNESGTELIQIQRDWFARNWRKVQGDETYPHFDVLFPQFQNSLGRFANYLRKHGIGELAPTQCELTYLNQIRQSEVWESHADAHRVISLLASPSDRNVPIRETSRLAVQYLLRDADSAPYGRLHLTFEPAALVTSGDPIFVLTLTAKGKPLGEGLAGVEAFMHSAHRWIVETFTATTTDAMHELWGMERDG